MPKTNSTSSIQESVSESSEKEVCGIIMPISAIEGCSSEHWKDVLCILNESIDAAGYTSNLVSDASDSGIIQKRIIQNIYENPIVVCDVSAKNPNVMFELGMRLAFDKPTIIIKDDYTDYSFDTSIIEHLSYPRDLTYWKILDFKKKLTEKIKATVLSSKKPEYTTFLKHFGEYKVAQIQDKKVTSEAVLINALNGLENRLDRIENSVKKQDINLNKNIDKYKIDDFYNTVIEINKKHKNTLDFSEKDGMIKLDNIDFKKIYKIDDKQ